MSYLHKQYIDTVREEHKIKLTVSFNKDTYHRATGKAKERGYQVTCTPIEREKGWEKSSAFSGFYELVYPAERQSKKKLAKALGLVEDNMERYVQYFRDRGIKFENDDKLNVTD